MTIVHNNTNSWKLSSIAEGEVFEFHSDLCLKTSERFNHKIACVRLVDGHIDWLDEGTFVYKREAKVVIE